MHGPPSRRRLADVEIALYQAEQMHRRLIDHIPFQIFWKDLDLRYLGCNIVFARAAGLSDPSEVVGKCDDDFPWAPNAERIRMDDRGIIDSGQPKLDFEDHLIDPDGVARWYVINKLPLHDQAGQIIGVLGTIEDITARKDADQALRLQSRALEASVNGIVITSCENGSNAVEYANAAFTRITGYPHDEVIGRDCRYLQGADRSQEGLDALRHALRNDSEVNVVLRNYRKDGSLFWNQLRIAPVNDGDGRVTHHVGVLDDITHAMRYQAELEHKANHDALTGLPNRNLFNDRLEQSIAFAARYGHTLWVALIDLDNFKFVNDTLGHHIGDRLLQTVAQRLSSCLRECDTVARLGGDEFMLLLLGHPNAALAHRIVHNTLAALSAPVHIDSHELAVSCSIGVSSYPKDGRDSASLIQHADIAMYRAKEAGRNQLQFYTEAMNERLTERTNIENALRHAIARGEFALHYQPRVDLHSGEMAGLEALIRWHHPILGEVPPARFIAVAEETGTIVEIGKWVLHTACQQARAWQDAGLPPMRMAVNVSARQFRHPHFREQVIGALKANGLEPNALELELTESLMMQNVDATQSILVALKQLGVAHSIDDFGTGYSSLNYLMRFPLDYLKIDQSFIRDMLSDPNGAAIVRSTIALGHSLGFKVIAEGVETAAQLSFLERHGCDEIQGYYFSRPLAAPAMQALMASRRRLPASNRLVEQGRTLLLLDDEPNVLASLARMFRPDGYNVLQATTPDQAFELLALHDVQVVISDQQMPAMRGTDFLQRVKQIHPDTVRIILSGHANLETLIEAINSGAIYRFFTKPWHDQTLRRNVQEAFAHQRQMRGARELPATGTG
ncbi:MAG: EAL domain-containing protein [Pseudomonadota bacterium]